MKKAWVFLSLGIFVTVYAVSLSLATWGPAAAFLGYFFRNGWVVTLGAALAAIAARRFLGLSPRPISTAFALLLLHALVFYTRILLGTAAPTLLFVATFLLLSVLFGVFGLDRTIALGKHVFQGPRLKGAARPLAAWLLLSVGVGFVLWLVGKIPSAILAYHPGVSRYGVSVRNGVLEVSRVGLAGWIFNHFYALTLLVPLLSGWIRWREFSKKMEYLRNVAITYTAWFLLAPLLSRAPWGQLYFLLTLPWVHVYWDEIVAAIQEGWLSWKRAETEGGGKSWERAARWVAVAKERFGTAEKSRQALTGAGTALKGWGVSLRSYVVAKLAGRETLLRRTLLALAAVAVFIPAARWVYRWTHVTVVEFSPSGLVSDRVAIRISFSGDVKPRLGDLRRLDCFKITPPLAGNYRQESPRVLAFIPSEPLKPSTRYVVQFDGANVMSSVKAVQGSAETEFNTDLFRVTNARVFYNLDAITAQDMEVVGELAFNFPVALDELRRNAKITKDDKPLPVEWERAIDPTRFYFRSEGVKPSSKEQKVQVSLSGDLGCIGGTLPLENEYQALLVLPEKPKPQVTEVRLFHEPGNTLVSVLFNTPVSQDQVMRCLRITPALPVDVKTEYAMAILRGPFKPNVNYTVHIASGLVARSGEVMVTPHTGSVRIEDLPASVKFSRPGNILSLSGPQNLAVKTVNLDTVGVRISKVFRNNLLGFLNNKSSPPLSKQIYSGFYRVEEGEINEEVTQYIGLSAFQKEPYKGLFQVELYDPKSYYNRENAWFLCTDLGLVAKHSGDDLWVWVVSVNTLRPVADARVELVSDTNQIMESQPTDGAGRAVFSNWRNHPYRLNPQFLVAKKDDDFSFLYFQETEKNAYAFPISGDPFTREGLEAFLTPERGVYRPGETAFVTTIVRTAERQLPPDIPVQLTVRDPRGAEYAKLDGRLNGNGLAVFNVTFPLDALTGAYDVRLEQPGSDRVLGTTSLKVEEFLPDKLKVAVKGPADEVMAGQPLTFTVSARQMFGPPAIKHRVTASVRFYSRIFSPAGYDGYVFQDSNRSFSDEQVDLGDEVTDDKGEKEYSLPIPEVKPPSSLRAYLYSEVFDTGGRPVSAAGYADVNVYPHYLGVKVEETGPRRVGQEIKFRQVAVDPTGKAVAVEKMRLVIRHKAWYSVYRHGSWGRDYYQSSTYEEILVNEVKDLPAKSVLSTFNPEQEGEYTILLVSPSGMRSSVTVDVLGTGFETANLQSPEKLQIVLDKEDYAAGEEVRATVRSPFPGKLFLTVEREKVYETRVIDMTSRETTVRFDVKNDYTPNMYIVGLVVRSPDTKLDTLPMESFGIAPLNVETKARAIPVTWGTPTAVTSADGIDVSLQVGGDPDRTNVVLAAVDEGVLQVTGFKTPDPLAFFYRKNGLTTHTYSLMDLLLPDLEAKKLAVGGGDEGEFTRRHLNPVQAKKKKSMAVMSGILSPGADGKVTWHVNTPGFNGEIRLMALAVRGDRFGSSAKSVQVADPIVLMPAFPRFVSPNDEFQIPVDVYNKTGRAGTFTVVLRTEGPVKVTESTQKVELPKEGQTRLVFSVRAAADAGVAKITLTARGNERESRTMEELSVRPATHLATVMKQGSLAPGASVELAAAPGYIPFGQRLRLGLSGNPMYQYLGVLDRLITYPYGCAEQTVSQAFPLLYLKDLGFATGRFAERANAIDTYVQGAVDRLQKLQLPNGEFSFWPGGGSGGRWLSYYVSHFLIEAQSQGYKVNPVVLGRVRTLLTKGVIEIPWEQIQAMSQNQGAQGDDESATPRYEGGEGEDGDYQPPEPPPLSAQQAAHMAESRLDRRGQQDQSQLVLDPYLLYLKALLGQPDRESMAVVAARKPEELDEVSRALLSMAYSRIGDRETALKLLKPDFKSRWLYRQQFGDFNSPVRNSAMYLAALALADPASTRISQIVDYLGTQMKNGYFGSTQENAWALMALGRAFNAEDKRKPLNVSLTANGQPYPVPEGLSANIKDLSLSGKKLALTNKGDSTLYYHWMVEGTPLAKAEKPRSNGLTVSRTYRDTQGNEVNLSNVPQGDLVVVTLTVTAEKEARNVVVVDLLPGGFEIENPRLRSRGELGFDPAFGFNPAYQDIRDDRLLLFTDGFMGTQNFSYAVRAVTPGRYTVPNPFAEAMYDPDVNGEGSEPLPLVVADVKP